MTRYGNERTIKEKHDDKECLERLGKAKARAEGGGGRLGGVILFPLANPAAHVSGGNILLLMMTNLTASIQEYISHDLFLFPSLPIFSTVVFMYAGSRVFRLSGADCLDIFPSSE
ncbi:hypothetical protein LZ32DRAFT_43384 [Colletotrichum eremochloae]|nr:hypothetical protein LZ32DRAFT_43384 [Colletotrichum eremochloae]